MTYRPVENPSGTGRKPMEIPEKLLSLLRQSYATGQRVEIDRAPDDPPDAVDELRRTLTRAGYRHFPDRSVRHRVTDDQIIFWMTDKKSRKGK